MNEDGKEIKKLISHFRRKHMLHAREFLFCAESVFKIDPKSVIRNKKMSFLSRAAKDNKNQRRGFLFYRKRISRRLMSSDSPHRLSPGKYVIDDNRINYFNVVIISLVIQFTFQTTHAFDAPC